MSEFTVLLECASRELLILGDHGPKEMDAHELRLWLADLIDRYSKPVTSTTTTKTTP